MTNQNDTFKPDSPLFIYYTTGKKELPYCIMSQT